MENTDFGRTDAPLSDIKFHAVKKYFWKYFYIFGQYCDVFAELDLRNGFYQQQILSETDSELVDLVGNYKDTFYKLLEMTNEEDKERVERILSLESLRSACNEGKKETICEYRITAGGRERWVQSRIFFIEAEQQMAVSVTRNITADKKLQEAVQDKVRLLEKKALDDERYRVVVEQLEVMVIEWNRETNVRYISPELCEKIWGNYNSGRDLFEVWAEGNIVCEYDRQEFAEFKKQIRENIPYIETTIRLLNRDKKYVWYRIAVSKIYNSSHEVKRIIGTVMDVEESMRYKVHRRYFQEMDSITGIYNEDAFYMRVNRILRENTDEQYAMIRIDITRFKYINEIYGVEEGDRLLKYIGTILIEEVSGESNAYGRINGDIFAVLLKFKNEKEILDLIECMDLRVNEFGLGRKVSLSYGICIVKDKDIQANILCDWANLALKTVKENRIKKYAFYKDELRIRQLNDQKIEDEMENALREGQFHVFLQPKYNISTEKVIGAEALVRWFHPKEGIIPPDQFIPLFEKNGFIIKMDEYIWEESCKVIQGWLEKGYEPIPISVNISRIHIYNKGFEQRLIQMLEDYKIPFSLIEVELTESTFVSETEELYQKMQHLQDLGITFSMDDFGAGYSSLNMLKNAPINTIKLDREFLNETTSTPKGQTIVSHTIAMVNQLGLNVIAEGVETRGQAEFLSGAGCANAQGFFFSKPMPVKEFNRLVFQE